MIVDFSDISPEQSYIWMTQAIIPRPIAWVLSENKLEDYNLAPFSYFNAIASKPALIAISLSVKPNGDSKDTLCNIRERPDFTVHIADATMLEAVNQSSFPLDYGRSELTQLSLETTPILTTIRMPRLINAPIALACTLYKEISLTDEQSLILGQLNHLYINDDCLVKDYKNRTKIEAQKVNPLLRLGAGSYAALGKTINPMTAGKL